MVPSSDVTSSKAPKRLLLTSVLVKGLGELVDCRGDLKTLLKDGLLALETNVLGPFDETAEVALGLDVLSCKRPPELATVRLH